MWLHKIRWSYQPAALDCERPAFDFRSAFATRMSLCFVFIFVSLCFIRSQSFIVVWIDVVCRVRVNFHHRISYVIFENLTNALLSSAEEIDCVSIVTSSTISKWSIVKWSEDRRICEEEGLIVLALRPVWNMNDCLHTALKSKVMMVRWHWA